METALPVIETRGLTKTYKRVQALKSLDLQVQQNTVVILNKLQLWATWLLYAILVDLTDAVAERLNQLE